MLKHSQQLHGDTQPPANDFPSSLSPDVPGFWYLPLRPVRTAQKYPGRKGGGGMCEEQAGSAMLLPRSTGVLICVALVYSRAVGAARICRGCPVLGIKAWRGEWSQVKERRWFPWSWGCSRWKEQWQLWVLPCWEVKWDGRLLSVTRVEYVTDKLGLCGHLKEQMFEQVISVWLRYHRDPDVTPDSCVRLLWDFVLALLPRRVSLSFSCKMGMIVPPYAFISMKVNWKNHYHS